jgi:hypothetical protein
MGGFAEEVYCALLEAAKATERLEARPEEVIGSYLRAHQARPSRAEPLYELARYCRTRNDYALAFLFADAAARIPLPEGDVLFVPLDVYTWRIHDELSIAAYWTGRHELCRALGERLLNDRRVPETELGRIGENVSWARRALAARKA